MPTDPPSEHLQFGRAAERGFHDRATIDKILDAGSVCHLGYVHDGHPTVVPTLYGRDGDTLYVHGSVASRAMHGDRLDVCLTVTHVDGLVLARSAFHHSINYRSVMVYGPARRVDDRDELVHAVRVVTEHVVPGRWEHTREPSPKEQAATAVLALGLEEATAKIRAAGVNDDEADLGLPYWAGVVPVSMVAETPLPDPGMPPGVDVPQHVREWQPRRD